MPSQRWAVNVGGRSFGLLEYTSTLFDSSGSTIIWVDLHSFLPARVDSQGVPSDPAEGRIQLLHAFAGHNAEIEIEAPESSMLLAG